MNFIWQILQIAAIVYFVLGVFLTGVYVAATISNKKHDELVTPPSEIIQTAVMTLLAWPMLVYYLIQVGREDE